ncbi:HNH endonuclease [Novosphingobium sp. FSY-8]|uniref:HNH endonuclease n=1 Tax=Novosphingobium ovatum TaxID=1908523 RepID=A0ABW9XB21_9SPHN|nr:HNH endonuclease [Novosphingobium ovatum]NBC35726.1 HNH endonuclease [Novosphingobium ovatum]
MAKRRAKNDPYWDVEDEAEAPPPEPCWLCERPLGSEVVAHHPVPKSRGGRDTVRLHPICHQALHNNFTNAELARIAMDLDALRRNDGVAKFLTWVEGKDPDFYVPTAKKGR